MSDSRRACKGGRYLSSLAYWVVMRRSAVVLVSVVLVCAASAWAYWSKVASEADASAKQFRRVIEASRSDESLNGLPYDWLDCLERYWSAEDQAASRVVCETWTAQGGYIFFDCIEG